MHDYDNATSYLNTIGLSYAHVFHSCSINCTCGKTWLIDEYYKKSVLALTTADALSIPHRKVGFYKYWWDQELDELKTQSIESHQLWVAAGRPRSVDLYDRKRTCKAQYRRGLRHHQQDACCEVSNVLHDCLMQKDNTEFWKCWNSKFKRQNKQCIAVGGLTSSIDIANSFADNFASVCHYNTPAQHERLKSEFVSKISKYSGTVDNVLLDSELVQAAKFKCGKLLALMV